MLAGDTRSISTVTPEAGSRVAVHADREIFLNPESGFVLFCDAGGVPLDRVAWSEDQPDGMPPGPGGIVESLAPGSLVARAPLANPPNAPFGSWMALPLDQASPGAPNPTAEVAVQLPPDGSLVVTPGVTLRWYPVVGIARYHVQVAAGKHLAAVVGKVLSR